MADDLTATTDDDEITTVQATKGTVRKLAALGLAEFPRRSRTKQLAYMVERDYKALLQLAATEKAALPAIDEVA